MTDPWAAWREAIEHARTWHALEDERGVAFESCQTNRCVLARAVAALLPVVESAAIVNEGTWSLWKEGDSEKYVDATIALRDHLASARAVAEGGRMDATA